MHEDASQEWHSIMKLYYDDLILYWVIHSPALGYYTSFEHYFEVLPNLKSDESALATMSHGSFQEKN